MPVRFKLAHVRPNFRQNVLSAALIPQIPVSSFSAAKKGSGSLSSFLAVAG